ncbi:MAG: PAS domain S-box protein [Fibrobacterota bacterium]
MKPELFKNLFYSTPLAGAFFRIISAKDDNLKEIRIINPNTSFLKLTGIKNPEEENVLHPHCFPFLEFDTKTLEDILYRSYSSGKAYEFSVPLFSPLGDLKVWAQEPDENIIPVFFALENATEKSDSKERYSLTAPELLESIPVPVFYKDRDCRYIGFNKPFLEFTGRKEEELLGKTVYETAPPELAKKYDKMDRDLINSGGTQIYEYKVEKKDGSTRDVVFSKTVYGKTDKGAAGIIGIITDITERRKSEAELRDQGKKLSSILTNMRDAVWSVSWPEMELLYMNPAAEDLYGYSFEKFVSNPTLWRELTVPEDRPLLVEAMEQLKQKGTAENDRRIIKADGNIAWINDKSKLILNENNEPVRIEGIISDITERKKYETQLLKSEQKFRGIIENSPDGFVFINRGGKIVSINNRLCELTGYCKEDIEGKFFLRVPALIKQDLGWYFGIFRRTLKDGHADPLTFRYIHKNGSIRYGEARASILREGKRTTGIQVILSDITKRERDRAEIVKSNRLLESVLSNAPFGIHIFEPGENGFRVLNENSAAERIFGLRLSVMGDINGAEYNSAPVKIYDYETKRHIPLEESPVTKALRGKTSTDKKLIVRRNNEELIISATAAPVYGNKGEITAAVGIFYDITNLVKTRKAYKDSLYELEMINHNVPNIIWKSDVGEKTEFTNTYISDNAEKFLGLKPGELASDWNKYFSMIKPEYVPVIKNIFKKAAENPGQLRHMEYEIINGAGEIRWFASTVKAIKENNKTTFFGYSIDITENKEAEKEIEEKREQFKTIFHNSPQPMLLTEIESGKIVEANRIFCRRAGAEESDIIGKTSVETGFISAEIRQKFIKEIMKKGFVEGMEIESINTHGENLALRLFSRFITANSKKYILTIFDDITKQKKAEEELQKSQKLESLGVLAGGIAHDFNNLLEGIYGSINIAKVRTKEKEAQKALENSLKTMTRAKSLTRQLLTFAKGGSPAREVSEIANILKDTANFSLSGSSIKAEYRIADDLKKAEFDKGQLAQVIENIILNSKEAVPRPTKILIEAENQTVKADSEKSPGKNFIRIKISDNGPGIERKIIHRIFDPFFSTKSGGTGLGLSTAYSIIKRHSGFIEVESENNKGCSFTIYIPAFSQKKAKQYKPKGAYKQTSKTDNEKLKVLIMDDEEIIRDVSKQIFEMLGFSARCAEDGESAIKLYSEHLNNNSPFDLLLLDLTVPGSMDGSAVMKKLKEIHPEARGIVTSGYSDNPVMSNPSKFGFEACLPKPYLPEDLQEILSRIFG